MEDENKEVQKTEESKSNKTTITIFIVSIVVLILVVGVYFFVGSGVKSGVGGTNDAQTLKQDARIKLTQQQQIEKQKELESVSSKKVKLTEKEKKDKKALLESILNK